MRTVSLPPSAARPATAPGAVPPGRGVVTAVVAPVADHLVASDLPRLPPERRAAVVGFTCHRIAHLPDVVRVGVLAVAVVHRALLAAPAGHRLLDALGRRPLPLLGEYTRLVRSLVTAFVWETWPDTAPDGAPEGAT